jgi:signal transduction histidine kinase
MDETTSAPHAQAVRLPPSRAVTIPARGPPAGRAADTPEMTLRLTEDHDLIAEGLNDVVVHRLFSAGLTLEAALVLIGTHPAARKIEHAIGELDQAIRDLRSIVFDRPPTVSPGPGGTG